MTDTLEFWDPHFHIWDLRPDSVSGHEGQQLIAVRDQPVYGVDAYEADVAAAGPTHTGGAWLEAVSVCHVGQSGTGYTDRCLAEARWVAAQLATSKRDYVLVPTMPLEDPGVDELLARVAAIDGVRGIRQILNHEPSWPRNAVLGDLLDHPGWRAGYAALARHGLSFDLQLNPHQFAAAAALVRATPDVPVIINHLGSPTWADLTERPEGYRRGLRALAACPHTSIKLSMLVYAHADWDQQAAVVDTVHWIVDTFGPQRCCFATNYPVDMVRGWPAERLFTAFRQLAARYSDDEQRQLFAGSARRAYRA